MKMKKNKAYTFEGLSPATKADLVRLAVNNNKGRFMGFKNVKADGSIREWRGVKIIEVQANGNVLVAEPNNENAIRTINPNTVLELRANGGMLKFLDKV